MKLTQAMSQPSNRNIAKANQEKGNVFQHHRQITSQNQNQTIQKQTNMALTKGFRIFIKEERTNEPFLMRSQRTTIHFLKSIFEMMTSRKTFWQKRHCLSICIKGNRWITSLFQFWGEEINPQ